jgi:hypothetical protein
MTSERPTWTTPEDVTALVARRWEDGRILSASIGGEAVFPFRISLRSPRPAELGTRFDDVKNWVRDLDEGSKAHSGFGYELGWTEVANRVVGAQRVPSCVTIPTQDDGLWLIRKRREAERFRVLAAETLAEFPQLSGWLVRRPLIVLKHGSDWERVLAVLRWFRANPRPRLYLRQLDVPGVDTKFVESHRGLLSQLLDLVLPASAIDPAFTGASGFEPRHGLRSRPVLVRLRILDQALRVRSLSDLTVPVSELAELDLPATRVFVTENEVNGLTFPDMRTSIVIFGLGYGVERLAAIPWLRERELHYWGDIDTHGFAILSKLRAAFPRASSLLMDRETLLTHRTLWVREDEPHQGDLSGLTESERSLFDDLRCDRLGDRVRLEQERIGFRWLCAALEQQ